MASYKTLVLEIKDTVAWVRMNRPEALNALDMTMTEELHQAMASCFSDQEIRVVVLTGTGRAFSSGGDVKFFAEIVNEPARAELFIKELAAHAHRLVSEIVRMPKPVIAAVKGVAAGAAFGISLACDMTVAADDAQFMVAYTGIGLTPDAGTTYNLCRLVGIKKAKEIILLNEALSAKEALNLGIINRVVPADQFDAHVTDLAIRLAQGPIRAYGRIKNLVHKGFRDTLETQMENERIAIGKSIKEEECKEGITAFIQKRKADFRSVG